MIKYAFHFYVYEWEERKEKYMFDENIVDMDGQGWNVVNIIKIEWEESK